MKIVTIFLVTFGFNVFACFLTNSSEVCNINLPVVKASLNVNRPDSEICGVRFIWHKNDFQKAGHTKLEKVIEELEILGRGASSASLTPFFSLVEGFHFATGGIMGYAGVYSIRVRSNETLQQLFHTTLGTSPEDFVGVQAIMNPSPYRCK
jgi:hypothetical protein